MEYLCPDTDIRVHEVFKMAADKGEGTSRKWRKSDGALENNAGSDEEEEPNFSDREDFVDDITDEGAREIKKKIHSICLAGIFRSCTPFLFDEIMCKILNSSHTIAYL